MRLLRVAVCLLGVTFFCAAGVLPVVHLEPKTLQTYQDYVAKFEKENFPSFEMGNMWIDGRNCCGKKPVDLKNPVVEPRFNSDIPGGSIHHFSGTIHVTGGTIDDVRRIMKDYPNYPKYFPSDLSRGSGTVQPDSTPNDEHYHAELVLTQSTVWMSVNFTSLYDTHYMRLSPDRWMSKSSSISSREWKDTKNEAAGFYSDSEDHGLLWRANTCGGMQSSAKSAISSPAKSSKATQSVNS